MKTSLLSQQRWAALAALVLSASTAQASLNPFHAARRHDLASSWKPARQTGEPLPLAGEYISGDYAQGLLSGAHNFEEDHVELYEALTTAPAPTAPPTPVPALVDRHELQKRNSTDNTCGYLSGWSTYPFSCSVTDACVINSYRSIVGCCPDTSLSCPLFTTCMAQSQSAIWSANNDTSASNTLLCSSDAYPECVTHIYEDSVFSGYILYGCGRTKAIDSVYYTTTILTSSASSLASSSSPPSSSSSSERPSKSSSITNPSVVTTTVVPSPSPEPKKKSTNVGAIVGGVVGGVGGLAVIALAGFLIMRHKRNEAKTMGGAAAGVGGGAPGAGQPPMQQQYYTGGSPSPGAAGSYGAPLAAGAAGGAVAGYAVGQQQQPQQQGTNGQYNPHHSLAAGAVSPTTTVMAGSDVGSPYSASASPKPGMGYQSGPVPNYDAAELPVERADGELRELA